MAAGARTPDLLLAAIALAAAVLIASLAIPFTGRWDAVLFAVVLFALLWAVASKQGWHTQFRLPFVRSDRLADAFLGLAVIIATLGIAWLTGSALARSYSDLLGIFCGLFIFGALMLVVGASRNWQ